MAQKSAGGGPIRGGRGATGPTWAPFLLVLFIGLGSGAAVALLSGGGNGLFGRLRARISLVTTRRSASQAARNGDHVQTAAAVAAGIPASTATLLTQGISPIPIIMYHDVMPTKQVWFDLTTYQFRHQMADLAAAGAHPITMQQVYDHLNNGTALPDKPILLTFDDCTLGEFTQALPILKAHHYPAVFFVQTAYVGTRTEKEHMSWEQLRQAEASGLISVQSHSVTHPEDITTLTDAALDNEMQASKQAIEMRLGHTVSFIAYPSGHCDARVANAAQRAGYLAAVTMDRGWAASPSQAFFMPRFTPMRLAEVISVWRGDMTIEPPLPRYLSVPAVPLARGIYKDHLSGTEVQWIVGGALGTQALNMRKTVGEMALAAGAKAALNGSFFADARVAGTGSGMIGPVLCRVDNNYKPATAEDEPRIMGRPLVLIGGSACLVLPYMQHLGHSLEVFQSLMPDVKDAFLGGGWIVHNGKALSRDYMLQWGSKDADDARHRSFVGIDGQNRYMLGATQDSIGCAKLGRILQRMGVQEAWLMDSGFSTSLIWQNHVLVSGHSRPEVPSRPVPHALFLFGDPAPDSLPAPADSAVAAGPGAYSAAQAMAADGGVMPGQFTEGSHRRRHHRSATGAGLVGTKHRRRHRKHSAASPSGTVAPATGSGDSMPAPEAPIATPEAPVVQ